MTRIIYRGEALEAHNAAAELRTVIRKALTKNVPHVKCRVRTVDACVAVVVLHADELSERVWRGEPCPVREVIDAALPGLPVGVVRVSYEVTA